jgi:hypothetical protein
MVHWPITAKKGGVMKALLGLGILVLICTGCATDDSRGGIDDGSYQTSGYQSRYGTSSEDRRFENHLSRNLRSTSASIPNMR